jgi:general secretion pathway protein L
MRRTLGVSGQRLLLSLEGDAVVLTRVSDRESETVGRYPLEVKGAGAAAPLGSLAKAREIILCLPDEQTLVQRLTLPLAVEENLRRVLGYTMDQNTPFSVDQVYYDGRVTARDRAGGSVEVELCVAPRDFVDRTLGELKALGLQPDRVTVGCSEPPGYSPVNLLPPEGKRDRFRVRRWVNAVLAVMALALAVALVALPLWEKRQTLRALRPQLAVAGEEARAAQRLREDLDRVAENADFLAEKRRSVPLVLAVLNELTHLVPDDTWISNLRIGTEEIELQGFSAGAAALIPILDASPFLRNVRFLSPVTRNRLNDTEQFHLSAQIELEQKP